MKIFPLSAFLSGHLFALGATFIWSSLYLFARVLADRFSPVELSFWRWILATAVFLPFVWREVWSDRHVIRQHSVRLMIISLIGMVCASLLIFLAGKTTTTTNMSLLMTTTPIFIALICRFVLHESLSGQQITGLLIAAIGVIILITKGDIVHLLDLSLSSGDLWILCGAICFGLYSVLVRFRPLQLGLNVFLCTIMGMGVIWLLPLMLWEWLYIKPLSMPSGAELLSLLHLSIGTSLIAFLFWNKSLALIGTVRAGVIYYSLPFFSHVLALIFLGEQLALPQTVGGALIIGGIVLSSFQAIRQALAAKRL